MKAFVLAAGLGTRLRPLTDDRPKALVEYKGKTLLQHSIDKILSSGVNEIIVNAHHFASQIKTYLQQRYPQFYVIYADGNLQSEWRSEIVRADFRQPVIYFSDESSCLLDTGGGLLPALSVLDKEETLLIYNVDIFSEIDLKEFLNRFAKFPSDVCLAVQDRETQRKLLFESNRLQSWKNYATGEYKGRVPQPGYQAYGFSGIHLVNATRLREFMEIRRLGDVFPILPEYLQKIETWDIQAYPFTDRWKDMGKLSAFQDDPDGVLSRL